MENNKLKRGVSKFKEFNAKPLIDARIALQDIQPIQQPAKKPNKEK